MWTKKCAFKLWGFPISYPLRGQINVTDDDKIYQREVAAWITSL